MKTPRLKLSYGQVAWALNLGVPPEQRLLDQLNYLRQLGIPFSVDERQTGPGNRRSYGFYEMVECGVALHAIRHGMKPVDFTRLFIHKRGMMRRQYRAALKDVPDLALQAPWIKNRGTTIPVMANESWLRLHDRYSEQPGTIEVLGPDAPNRPKGSATLDLVERYPGETLRGLVPLTRFALQWTAWALEAPEMRTGPKG